MKSTFQFTLACLISIAWNDVRAAEIDFAKDIQPIFEISCIRCHGAKKPKSGYRLDNREDALRGGDIGVAIIAGAADTSPLLRYVRHAEEDLEMPPIGKGDKLSVTEIDLLRQWINAGAVWNEAKTDTRVHFAATPAVRSTWVEGNEGRFSEQTGLKDGAVGGLADFALRKVFSTDTTLSIDGHAFAGQEDYEVNLSLQENNRGFIRAGARQWKRFYDTTGGFQPGVAIPPSLTGDLELELGKTWIQLGLTPADGSSAVLGYEYSYQNGAKSMSTWGLSSGIGIAPSFKRINQDVHRITFDLRHDWRGIEVSDDASFEIYGLDNDHVMQGDVLNGTASPHTAANRTDQYVGANTFRLEKQIRDDWFAAAGYHYSNLRGDNALTVTTTGVGGGFPEPRWQTDSILNKSQTHAFSVSSLFGPWDNFTISPVFQAEWNRRQSAGGADIGYIFAGVGTPVPIALNSSRDERITTEALTMRYTGIESVVISSDLRLRQEAQGINEQQIGGDTAPAPLATKNPSFLQRTDGDGSEYDLTVGLRWSPRPGWAFSTRVRRHAKETGYRNNQLLLSGAGPLATAMPGFIRWWDEESDEIRARITARLKRWWRANLTYQLTSGKYRISTATAALNPGGGGELDSSNSDSHTISFGNTINPNHRWHFAANASFTDAQTTSAANGIPSITAWRGQTYSAYGHVGFLLNERTDLACSYTFSKADFGQPIAPTRVLAGTDYTLHGLRAGFTRQLPRDIRFAAEYGFNQFDEPTAGGQNDYSAHGVFATVSLRWPEAPFAGITSRKQD